MDKEKRGSANIKTEEGGGGDRETERENNFRS